MPHAAQPLKVCDLVAGRYRLIRVIGRGGVSVVFEARDEGTGAPVALKALRADIAWDDRLLARFEREAEIASSLDHANLCAAIDFCAANGETPFLVMPLLEGASLADLLLDCGAMSGARAASLVGQILDGLSALHGAGIAHRDLKPENVFVTRDRGGNEIARILDFGTAKLLLPKPQRDTSQGIAFGTPCYMAPEQARGSEELDHRADIHAVGATLFEMLTGTAPYSGDTHEEVMRKIVTKPFPSPRGLNPSIPAPLDAIVLRATAKDANDRFQTALEMRDALDAALRT